MSDAAGGKGAKKSRKGDELALAAKKRLKGTEEILEKVRALADAAKREPEKLLCVLISNPFSLQCASVGGSSSTPIARATGWRAPPHLADSLPPRSSLADLDLPHECREVVDKDADAVIDEIEASCPTTWGLCLSPFSPCSR